MTGESSQSALDWLYRRRDRDGQTMISEEEFRAGDRLRKDFMRGSMAPRTTAAWGVGGHHGKRRRVSPDQDVNFQDNTLAAQERVRNALNSVQLEFRSLLMDVCCFDIKLTELERKFGWPQRSGKLVLQLALRQLARHYGIIYDKPDTGGRVSHWATPDYRPNLE